MIFLDGIQVKRRVKTNKHKEDDLFVFSHFYLVFHSVSPLMGIRIFLKIFQFSLVNFHFKLVFVRFFIWSNWFTLCFYMHFLFNLYSYFCASVFGCTCDDRVNMVYGERMDKEKGRRRGRKMIKTNTPKERSFDFVLNRDYWGLDRALERSTGPFSLLFHFKQLDYTITRSCYLGVIFSKKQRNMNPNRLSYRRVCFEPT